MNGTGSADNSFQNLHLTAWLRYFEDIGLDHFYRDRVVEFSAEGVQSLRRSSASRTAVAGAASASVVEPKQITPASPRAWQPAVPGVAGVSRGVVIPVVSPSLFEAVDRIANDSLERIREDIGDCTRCRLCEQRNKIVFGVGNPKADLVFIGEGPGRDEDMQGIPFVGRAGQLLTQMIEAMGLKREQVYIANVVKCRPPENRTPEKDEMATCSPFLMRQLDVIKPKVIVCLGNVAMQTLLATNRSMSSVRGQWFPFRGSKLLPTYHPAYLLRNPPAKADVWADLKKVIAELGLTPPKAVPKR